MPYLIFLALFAVSAHSNPFFDERQVPKDPPYLEPLRSFPQMNARSLSRADVLRVDVGWNSTADSYNVERSVLEGSGTEALFRRSQTRDPLGSYQASILDGQTVLAHDSLGTGQEYRRLVRAMTFRFPNPNKDVVFVFEAENPKTGKMEEVLRQVLPRTTEHTNVSVPLDIREIKKADQEPALVVNIYAEGYLENSKDAFFKSAQRTVDALKTTAFPGFESMTFNAVFSPSNVRLGSAKNLGTPIPIRDSFLGLYYPYWNAFGRWYNVVYPTSEKKYRDAIGSVPYDYPVVLIDNDQYWGIGNFNEITAIPTQHSAFTYLLTHEFGHYFGLNEEYESGGKTDLAFAPEIEEPWSQNITFLKNIDVKWKGLLLSSTPIPTPSSHWKGSGPYGAYKGGYAETEPLGKSHKPGYQCVMSSGQKFCLICKKAIQDKIKFDLGQ